MITGRVRSNAKDLIDSTRSKRKIDLYDSPKWDRTRRAECRSWKHYRLNQYKTKA